MTKLKHILLIVFISLENCTKTALVGVQRPDQLEQIVTAVSTEWADKLEKDASNCSRVISLL